MKRNRYAQRKQHFVPACYLKAWLDPSAPKTDKNKPYVWLFDLKGENPKAKAPEKIFRESEMYTLTAPDGGRDLRLEHGLGTIESEFTKVRNSKFNHQRPLTDEDWMWTCLFAATVHNRTAQTRDHWVEQWEMIRAKFEGIAGPDWESKIVPAEVESRVDRPGVYSPQPGDFDNLKENTAEILINAAMDAIYPALLGMHKSVLCTTDPLGFLTTDAPSTWFDPTAYRQHPIMRGVGLKNADLEITLPISPAQCLLFTHRPIAPLYCDITQDYLDGFNHRHAAFAPSTIVTRSNETRPIWFQKVAQPADAWESLHPDPADRHSWTSPDCPPGLLEAIDRQR